MISGHNYLSVSWAKGYQSKVEPKIALEELEKIREEHGEISADVVVETAKPKAHPLHQEIYRETDKEAARQFRLVRARNMTRSLVVVRAEAPNREGRVYEVIQAPQPTRPRRQVYKTAEEILADPVAKDELLASAIRDALAFRKRYNQLQELSQVLDAIDDALQSQKIEVK